MASGGMTDTNVDESSDILHDFPCKPCSDDGKNIEGVHFCAECQTYFCQACVTFHNKCFKTHTLYNKSGVKSGSAQYQQQTGGLTCDNHPGYPIQMYCREHDTVACAVCIAVDHRLCNSADFIPKLSKEILNGRDRKDVKISLEKMKKKLHSVKSSKLEQINEVSKEKEDILAEIEKMKERIIARVEEIEQTSVKRVEDKHKEIVDTIKTDIESIDAKVRAIDINIQKINEFKGNNEAKLFVVLNKAHEIESSSIKYLENCELVRYGKIVFDFNQNIEFDLSKVESLGTLKADENVEDGVADIAEQFTDASLVRECDVKMKDSERATDSCILGYGQIIIATSDSNLKRLDKTYKLKDECTLGKRICRIGPNELAGLDNYNVQIGFAGKSMVVTSSFTIPYANSGTENIYPLVEGSDLNSVALSSISFNDEKLYISATLKYRTKIIVNSFWCDKYLYKYAVLVYNIKGCHLETVLTEIKPEDQTDVNHVCISSDGSCMYVATRSMGLVTLDMSGLVVSKVMHKRLKNARYISEGSNGQLFVCGYDSHNIFLFDTNGKTIEEIVGRFDGLKNPVTVMYVKHKRHLVVADKNGVVQIFQLRYWSPKTVDVQQVPNVVTKGNFKPVQVPGETTFDLETYCTLLSSLKQVKHGKWRNDRYKINVDESSDMLHDFPCKPCSDDGKNIEGVHFCAECQTYFCQACVAFHNKCFKTHTLYKKSGVKSGSTQYQQQTGGLTCDKHPGNLIQMYCREHDTVSCAVCIAVDHRLCNSADFIPKLSKEILNGRDRKDVKISLEEMKKKLHSVKYSKLEQINEVNKEKEDLLTEIEKMKERIIARVEQIEQTSVKQVQDKHKVTVDKIKTDIESVDAKLRAIDSNIQKIDEFKGTNEAKLFVVLNKAHEVESSSIKYLENSELVRYGKIVFDFNQNIEFVLSKMESLGSLKADENVEGYVADVESQFSDASLVSECVVKMKDSEVATDSCILGNGQIIIATSESNLKRLDKTYKLKDECTLGKRICTIGPNELAGLDNFNVKIGFAGKSMVVTRSFEIPYENSGTEKIYLLVEGSDLKDVALRSISFNADKLYISAALEYETKIKVNDYRRYIYEYFYKYVVLVYNIKGCHLETVLTEIEPRGQTDVNHACISSNSSCMYVATRSMGLVTLDINGRVVSKVLHERLENARYVSAVNNGQLFVCGYGSHNIFLVDRHGKFIEEVVGRFDGLNNPKTVMYVNHQKHIVVTDENGVVQVFQLR